MKLFCLAIIFELHSSNLPKFEESNSNLDNYLHSPGVPFLPDFGCAGSLKDVIMGFLGGILGAPRKRGVF